MNNLSRPPRCLALLLWTVLAAAPYSGLNAQDAPRAARAVRDPRLLQDVDLQAFRRQMRATSVVVPPDSARQVRNVTRGGVNLLEASLVTISTPATTLTLELSVDPNPGLVCSRRGCAGDVRIGVVEKNRPFERIPLPDEMSIELYGPDSVAPQYVVLTATRMLQRVRVQSRTQEAVLKVHPVGLPSLDVALPVRALQLRMTMASETMDAWGLETTQLHIAELQGLDPGDTVEVRLQGAGVRVEPSVVKLTAFNGATVEIRSRRVGTASVAAFGPAYLQTTPASVQSEIPWSFILFTLAGGLIGAFFREKFFEATSTPRQAFTRGLASALMGALLAIGTVVGINLTSLPLPTGIASEVIGMFEGGIFAAIADALISARRGASPGQPADRQPRPDHQPA